MILAINGVADYSTRQCIHSCYHHAGIIGTIDVEGGGGKIYERDRTNERKGGVEMAVKRNLLLVLVGVIVLGAGFAAAQTTTHEIKQGTVVHVYGNNLVVKMSTGETKEFDVPEGFTFKVDGRDVTIDKLVPGTKLTSVVTTTETPHTVKVTEVKNAELVSRSGQTVVIRQEDGTLKKFRKVPDDVIFTVQGLEVSIRDIEPGSRFTATIVHTSVETITEQTADVSGAAPAKPAPAPVPVAKAAPAPASAPVALPHTGSSLPLVGLFGLLALAVSAGIGIIRRF
jgi:LPXTG-motif cell wall-anchored protein